MVTLAMVRPRAPGVSCFVFWIRAPDERLYQLDPGAVRPVRGDAAAHACAPAAQRLQRLVIDPWRLRQRRRS